MDEFPKWNRPRVNDHSSDDPPPSKFELGVATFCYGLSAAVWAVVGLVMWIPLLTRCLMAFTAAVMVSVHSNRPPIRARQNLNYAIHFYRRGFRFMFSNDDRGGYQEDEEGGGIWKTLPHLLFAVLFWTGLVLSYQLVFNSGVSRFDAWMRGINPAVKTGMPQLEYKEMAAPIEPAKMMAEKKAGARINLRIDTAVMPVLFGAANGFTSVKSIQVGFSLKMGDMIDEIDGYKITSIEDIETRVDEAMKNGKKPMWFRGVRGRDRIQVLVGLP